MNSVMSCAWQCLRALKTICEERPEQCLRLGVAAAVLKFFDFFSASKQVSLLPPLPCPTYRQPCAYPTCSPPVCGNADRKWRSRSSPRSSRNARRRTCPKPWRPRRRSATSCNPLTRRLVRCFWPALPSSLASNCSHRSVSPMSETRVGRSEERCRERG